MQARHVNVRRSVRWAATLAAFSCVLAASAGAQDAGAVFTHWESYKRWDRAPSEDQHLTDRVLIGAIDLHAHIGPDSYPRQWDAWETAELAASRGMRGIVIKNHWSQTAVLAQLIQTHLGKDLEVFGALALNTPVGGLNAQALRYMVDVNGSRGKVLWLPTHDSEHEVRWEKSSRPYVAVSAGGELLPETLAILDLVAEHDLTLATGHVTPDEMLAVMREAKTRGIERIIVTHPTLGEQFTYLTDEQIVAAVELGGVIEITAGSLYRAGPGRERALAVIRLAGPGSTVVSSDSGLIGTPNLTDAFVMAARELRAAGYAEHDLDLMFKINPARLLGLPPPPSE